MPENNKKKTTSSKPAAAKSKATASKTKSNAATKKNQAAKKPSTTQNVESQVAKEFKAETKNTVKEVKASIKNADIKKDTKGASNVISSFLKNPIDTLKNISDDTRNKNLITAIVILAVWTAVLFIESMFGYSWTFRTIGIRLLTILRTIVVPIISLCVMSIILYLMQKSNRRAVTTIFTTVTIATIPVVFVDVLKILALFASDFSKILSPISYIAVAITMINMFFATKSILDIEDNSRAMPKFVLSQTIYYVVYFVFTFLAIYMAII